MENKPDHPNSYYVATAKELREYPQLSESIEADVCIIGGGFTGLLAALNLAEKGYQVVLLEACRIGWGASGRNGGQVGSGYNKKIPELERHYGTSLAKDLWNLTEDAKSIVKDRITQHDIDCDLSFGNVTVSNDQRDSESDREYVDKLNRDYNYNEIRYLDEAEVHEMFHSPLFKGGGSLDLGGMHLHPLNFMLGLAKAATKAGVQIFEQSRVIQYTKLKPSVIRTEQGQVMAKHIVLACNAYLEKLEKRIAGKMMPINNFILATEPLEESEARFINRDNVCAHDKKFHVHYFRMSKDHRLIFGGGENYTTRIPKDLKAYVRKTMLNVFPSLESKIIDYAWSGSVAVTVNRMPHLGRLKPNVFFAHGFSGHGIALASLAGTLIAEAIDGTVSRFDVFSKIKIPTFPGGTMLRWPGFYLGMIYSSIRDRL
ncbi:MAG TPA: FAD-binding oxidoreductase [Gammaproteobacteria bacterium]|jgi:gamma-glutamylputrescine oxidase|nr:FAD-binding oxidoreductase [Gammaproteobacteria bacterium]HJP43252.1 FAD-binding oxidoreductase [Gammaproteobacteria bacterium]